MKNLLLVLLCALVAMGQTAFAQDDSQGKKAKAKKEKKEKSEIRTGSAFCPAWPTTPTRVSNTA